jgi:hypothetical protein
MFRITISTCVSICLITAFSACTDGGATGPDLQPEDQMAGFILTKNGDTVLEVENGQIWGDVTVLRNAVDT